MSGLMTMNLKMPEYASGTCNIGPGEIRRRQIVSLIGAIASAMALVGFIITNAPRGARLSIFFPLLVASIGWVQARRKFCLAFGFMGTFNFGKLGQLSRVTDPASRAADRSTALNILMTGVALALAGTLMVILIPL